MQAAEAVANSLTAEDIAEDRCVPPLSRIREVALNVATAVVLQAQKQGIARKVLGSTEAEIKEALAANMWVPNLEEHVVEAPYPETDMHGDEHGHEH